MAHVLLISMPIRCELIWADRFEDSFWGLKGALPEFRDKGLESLVWVWLPFQWYTQSSAIMGPVHSIASLFVCQLS